MGPPSSPTRSPHGGSALGKVLISIGRATSTREYPESMRNQIQLQDVSICCIPDSFSKKPRCVCIFSDSCSIKYCVCSKVYHVSHRMALSDDYDFQYGLSPRIHPPRQVHLSRILFQRLQVLLEFGSCRCIFDDLYEQCSDHSADTTSSSVGVGARFMLERRCVISLFVRLN